MAVEWRWFLTLACLGGCDQILGITPLDPIPDAPPRPLHCSSTSLIREEFDTKPAFFPAIYGTGGNAGMINAGKLQINMVTDGYTTVDGVWFYDMRDDVLTYELSDDNVDPANSVEIRIDGDPQFNNYMVFYREGTKLEFHRTDNGTFNRLGQITYSPTEHRFMRFNSVGDDVLFQTAAGPDGPFTTQVTAFNVGWLGSVRPGVRGTVHAPSFVILLDSVIGGSSSTGACPVRDLTDSFDGTDFDTLWKNRSVGSGTLTLSGGSVEMTAIPSGTDPFSASLSPERLYDVRNSSVAIEIEQMLDSASDKVFDFFVRGLGADEAMFSWDTDMLRVKKNGMQVMSTPFSPTQHRFWRIRESGGNVTWETSADGVAYDPQFVAPMTGFDKAEIYMHASGVSTPAATMKIAGINVPAPK